MSDERRTDERVSTNLTARWNGLTGGKEARIEDLSLGGCFVNTNGRAEVGELISVDLRLPSGEWLNLRGEVTTCQEGIGFGLRFSFLTEDEETELRQLIT